MSAQGDASAAAALTCVEFATPDDQYVFNSTGLIRASAIVQTVAKA